MGSVPYFPAEATLEFLYADRLVEDPSDTAKLHILGGLNPVEHLTQEATLRLGEMGGGISPKTCEVVLAFSRR